MQVDPKYTAEYDYIVVGMGYAGSIMTARLAQRAKGKKVLAIEYGGPVYSSTGGVTSEHATIEMTADMFQTAGMTHKAIAGSKINEDPSQPLAMPDVPGNYNNVAFRHAYGDGKFDMKEFPACWQGVGLGGNGLYNGALYQEPADWWWNDKVHNDIFVTDAQKAKGNNTTYDIMKGYTHKVREMLDGGIQSVPSADGVHYNHGLYEIIKPNLDKAGFFEAPLNTMDLSSAPERFYCVPAVNVKDGKRTGPRAWLELVMTPDGEIKPEFPNLTLFTYTKVQKILMDASNTVTGVSIRTPSGSRRGGTSNSKETVKNYDIKLAAGGKVIMTCGSLPTTRVLYKSGIGCAELNENVMPGNSEEKIVFTVDNPAIGTVVSEHVSTSLGMKYTGEEREQPNTVHYDPGNYIANIEHLNNYARHRSGPYAQYGPVVASHFVADLDQIKGLNHLYQDKEYESPLTTVDETGVTRVTTELFYNPYGLGHPAPSVSNPGANPYNGPGTFTIACMLLSPEMRGLFRMNEDNEKAEYVQIYMSDGRASWDPNEAQRAKLCLPDYRKQAEHDVGVMTASIKEVLSITADDPTIQLTLGPGDGQTHDDYKVEVCVGNDPNKKAMVAIKDLDATNADHVRAYVQYYDKGDYSDFTVNGEYMAIVRWQENHYNSTVPLARTYDVFGNELGDRKANYGLDPDTLEVRGTKGLCVCDASIFPKVIYCHPIGAIMAMAEWAADQICPE